MNTATESNNAETLNIEVLKLLKNKEMTRKALAKMYVEITEKLRGSIAQSNRYFDRIKILERQAEGLKQDLIQARGPIAVSPKKELMGRCRELAIEHKVQTRVSGNSIEWFDAEVREWVLFPADET